MDKLRKIIAEKVKILKKIEKLEKIFKNKKKKKIKNFIKKANIFGINLNLKPEYTGAKAAVQDQKHNKALIRDYKLIQVFFF